MTKKLLVKVTAQDCRWSYYNGTGKGGQNRNKKAKCARCFHDPSGAQGKCEEERSLEQNKKKAFLRMANSKEFQTWLRIESMRANGQFADIEASVKRDLLKTRVDVQNEKGEWVESPELKINTQDIENIGENEHD